MMDNYEPSLTDIPRLSGPWEFANAEEGYEYITSVDVNKMCYVDDDGRQHEIYLPTSRADEARQHFVNKRWDELAKFPAWDNQKYTDEDYTITKYKKNPTTGITEDGIVVKKQGEPLVKNADGKVVLSH